MGCVGELAIASRSLSAVSASLGRKGGLDEEEDTLLESLDDDERTRSGGTKLAELSIGKSSTLVGIGSKRKAGLFSETGSTRTFSTASGALTSVSAGLDGATLGNFSSSVIIERRKT